MLSDKRASMHWGGANYFFLIVIIGGIVGGV
jgi:hypothetical protein